MTYALVIYLDKKATEKIRRKIFDIAESDINSYMVTNKVSPHLTISLFEADNEEELKELLKELSEKITGEFVEISSIGTFEPKVIYFAPNKSDYLTWVNEITTSRLINIGIKPDNYYLPQNWVPHIALGVQLTSEELMRALEIAKKDFEPFSAKIEKVVLVKCNPYREIAECYVSGIS